MQQTIATSHTRLNDTLPKKRTPVACFHCRRSKLKCAPCATDLRCQRCADRGLNCERGPVSQTPQLRELAAQQGHSFDTSNSFHHLGGGAAPAPAIRYSYPLEYSYNFPASDDLLPTNWPTAAALAASDSVSLVQGTTCDPVFYDQRHVHRSHGPQDGDYYLSNVVSPSHGASDYMHREPSGGLPAQLFTQGSATSDVVTTDPSPPMSGQSMYSWNDASYASSGQGHHNYFMPTAEDSQ